MLIPIDFEYFGTAQENLTLVCCSMRVKEEVREYWLFRNPSEIDRLRRDIYDLRNDTFLAYSVVAEASSFLSLGLDPLNLKWIDAYLEYRCLSNHNDNYSYGAQLIKGKVKHTKKPKSKYEMTEEDKKKSESQKQEYGYGAAVFKTLGKIIDSDFKKEIRDLIIACNSFEEDEIQEMVDRKEDILRYCSSDTQYLEPMIHSMTSEYKRLLGNDFDFLELLGEMSNRSEYAVRTAKMERLGYPINYNKTRNFSSQVSNIIWECQNDINSQFQEPLFRPKSKKKPFDLSWNQVKTREEIRKWIKESGYKGWMLTDGGKSGIKDLSLSLDAFQKPIAYRHTYPEGNLLAQMQRYLKLKQGLNGFVISESSDKKFWDCVGDDARARPYMGIYGAQSSRSQPSATGFIPLKSAWMRALIEPKEGRIIAGIDFASQEFLLAALLSGDENMVRDYMSGDVYLAFGKSIGYIPKDATKSTHKKQRDECKHVVLGLSYDMSEYGLSVDLSEKFGRKVSTDEALSWINKHKRAYRKFWAWKDKIQEQYKIKHYIKLPDGWTMFGDNTNFRSVGNVPVQGLGACIMRKAVQLAQDRGLDVIYTLHDAIYIEFNKGSFSQLVLLAECMDEAFRYYFPEDIKSIASVRLDADIWGPNCKEEKFSLDYETNNGLVGLPVKSQKIYIDERAIVDYEKFSKYFEPVDLAGLEF